MQAHVQRNDMLNFKQLAGEYAANFVTDGMKVGLGTGSTVYWTIQKLGERVKKAYHFKLYQRQKKRKY